MKYSFKFTLFSKKVQMFHEGQMGIVIEKDSQVVCVYGTDAKHQNIFCAIPLCHPKALKGEEYVINFCKNDRVQISVADLQVVIDFRNRKCATNKGLMCYGSDSWGQNVQTGWGGI